VGPLSPCARLAPEVINFQFLHSSPFLRGSLFPDHSGFPHKRHCDLRLAFSPLHLEQRLYIFPVNH